MKTTYTVEWCGHKFTYKSDEQPMKAWAKLFFQILWEADATMKIYEDYEEDPVN